MQLSKGKNAQDYSEHQNLLVGSKKSIQQGRSYFFERSVLPVREHGKLTRTTLAAFFNRPNRGAWEMPGTSTQPLLTIQGERHYLSVARDRARWRCH